jgi:hypothetical protein
MSFRPLAIALVAAFAIEVAHADDLTGQVSVVDGDRHVKNQRPLSRDRNSGQ